MWHDRFDGLESAFHVRNGRTKRLANPDSLSTDSLVANRRAAYPAGIDSSSSTSTPPAPTLTPAPTIDPNLLINTVAPQPTIDSQILNNGEETVNFLLIGSDQRNGASFRTDTMIVAILRPNEGQVSLISISRDLWVSIPTEGNQRINTAYENGELIGYPGGGAALLKDTIQYNLGIRIDHTALVDFDGFRQIVDTLGGVDVPVSCPYTDWRLIDPTFNPELEDNWNLYTVSPGVLHMDGDLALWYARSPKNPATSIEVADHRKFYALYSTTPCKRIR